MKRGWVKLGVWWGIILGLMLIGLWMRFVGILRAYSFWNDEAHVAIWAKSLLLGREAFYFRGYLPTGLYQLFTYYLTAFSMWVFGMNEFGARAVYVVLGSLIIPLSAWAGWRLTNTKLAGILAGFLVAFSNLEIAWSQQVRPYIVLQFLFLIFVILWMKYLQKTLTFYKWLFWSFILSIVMMLFHTSSFIVGLVFFGFVIYKLKENNVPSKVWFSFLFLTICSLVLMANLDTFFYIYNFLEHLQWGLIKPKIWHFLFFWNHYWFYLLWAILGGLVVLLKKKYRQIIIFILVTTFLLYLAVLLRPSKATYVRYTLISFPFLFILAVVGINQVALWLSKNKKEIYLTLIVVFFGSLVWIGGGNKTLSFCPGCYHSINADVRENPLADYKRFFSKAKPYFDKNPDMALVDAWEDRDVWYLNRKVDAFMIARSDHRGKKTGFGGVFVTNVDELKRFLQKAGKALVVIEDWPSLAGDKMQAFVRNNLKFEYKVCDEKLANEGWCLELYSFGVKDENN